MNDQSAGPKMHAQPSAGADRHEPIAIVGMACRYPGANDVREFWDLLVNERNAIREVPNNRFDIEAFHDPRPAVSGKLVARSGGFMDDVAGFDADYFRISHREASRMDPQQRLVLEVSAEAIDDAFLSREELARHVTGVYVGAWASDWECHEYADRMHTDVYSIAGSGRCLLSGRVSFAFDLRGPSLTVDTGCSASLIAAHLACQSLWLGETSLAIVGGVNLVLDPVQGISFSQGAMLAPDGQCKAFSARADGLGRSDGCGVVVMMRLSQALERGARVYAVVRGSGASNDGFSNGLLTTPSEIGQQLAMREAYRSAGLSPNDVQYIEAHGTGTRAGDPVELRAVAELMRDRPKAQPCLIGSVKTNIGHSEGASGVAGLIKAALALKHRTIPKSLHSEDPTTLVDWNEINVRLASETQAWPSGLARAGVSSFGISGTDVHMVLEELPVQEQKHEDAREAGRAELLVLSGQSEPALKENVRAHREWLARADSGTGELCDLAYSASLGRRHHTERLAVVGHNRRELIEALDAHLQGEPHPALAANSCASDLAKPVFVFCGHGPQWDGMGRSLLESEPVFRAAIEACDTALRRYTDWSLLHQLERDHHEQWPIGVIQPSIFALQVALSALWRSWGVEPSVVVGHSMGEVAAAHVAGVLDLDDAARVISRRALNLQALAGQGGMLSVELGLAQAEAMAARYRGLVGVAAANSAHACVLSGDLAALAEIATQLRSQAVFCRELKVDAPAHSPQLDPLLPDFARAIAGVRPSPDAEIAICSTVTGDLLESRAFDAAYWVKNQRQPVLFGNAIEALVQRGHTLFLEIGPHPVLRGPIQHVLGAEQKAGLTLGSLRRNEPERAALLHSMGQLHTLGQPVNFRALHPDARRFVSLPRYAWQHEPFDILPSTQSNGGPADGSIDACALGEPIRSAQHTRSYLWQVPLSLARSTYLADHVLQGAPVLPGTAYVSMALSAAASVFGTQRFSVERLTFGTALVLSADTTTELQVALSIDQPGLASVRFYTAPPTAAGSTPRWTLHAHARARLQSADVEAGTARAKLDTAAIAARCQGVTPEEHYRAASAHQVEYGPAFRGVEQLWTTPQEALAKIALPKGVAWRKGAFAVHPALLDACWQALVASALGNVAHKAMYLPVEVEHIEQWREPGTEVWAHAQLREGTDPSLQVADVRVYDGDGTLLMETRGLKLRRIGSEEASLDEALYELAWLSRPAPAAPVADFAGQTWLVLADRRRAVGETLRALLEARGASCVVAHASSAEMPAASGGVRTVDPADPSAMRALVEDAASAAQRPLCGVVDLWPLDAVSTAEATSGTLDRAQTLGVVAAAHLVQALNECGSQQTKLWLVTAGAQAVTAGETVEIAQAPLWAFGRVLRYECPEFRIHNLDLGSLASEPADSAALTELVQELGREQNDDQIALRGSDRSVLQLVHAALAPADAAASVATIVSYDANYRLETSAAGVLENLHLRETERTLPEPGEIEIEMSGAGINFIDVMKALAIYPGMGDGPIEFGGECSGTIRALGANVEGFKVGQRVLAMANRAQGFFSRFVRTDATLAVGCPPQLDAAQAAAIPCVFLTAHYALNYLGRMRRGERVLIHSAAGGVGLAALALARRAGAEIFATAGSEEKREYLRGLGVQHVFDSRSTDFAAAIMQVTHGEGIDLVLNSLAGETIPLSLALLRDDGRFIEIGKRDIYEDMQLGLLPFKRSLTFSHIDISRLVRDKPQLMGDMLRELVQLFADGELQPLPVTTSSMACAADAFHLLAQAKHIGKVVLTSLEPSEIGAQVRPSNAVPLAKRDASYLITGGLGGLGLLVADWLVQQGARHLVLTGRSAPSAAAQAAIARLEHNGVQVLVEACDVGNREDVNRLMQRVQRALPALRGVIHAAAVLDDGLALHLTAERFATAMWPKMHGAFNLHLETRAQPLDFFVLFSSCAAMIGSPGQGNYAAGNEFMDALAHHRRAVGLPALSIDWGAWQESGMAARPDRAGRLAERGLGSIRDRQGLMFLERLMRSDRVQVGVVPNADFRIWSSFYPSSAVGMLETLLRETPTSQGSQTRGTDLRASILAAQPAERLTLLEVHVGELVRRVLRLPASKQLDNNQPLNRFGIDSLMAIELKNRLEQDLGVLVPVSKILLSVGLQSFARDLLEMLLSDSSEHLPAASATPAEQPAAVGGDALERMLADMADIDDEAADGLLDDSLELRAGEPA